MSWARKYRVEIEVKENKNFGVNVERLKQKGQFQGKQAEEPKTDLLDFCFRSGVKLMTSESPQSSYVSK